MENMERKVKFLIIFLNKIQIYGFGLETQYI